jgi:hypothetical protein
VLIDIMSTASTLPSIKSSPRKKSSVLLNTSKGKTRRVPSATPKALGKSPRNIKRTQVNRTRIKNENGTAKQSTSNPHPANNAATQPIETCPIVSTPAPESDNVSAYKVSLPVAVTRYALYCLREAYSTKKYGNMSMIEIYNCTNVGVDERLKHAAALLINARAQVMADVRLAISKFCTRTKIPDHFVSSETIKIRKSDSETFYHTGDHKIKIGNARIAFGLEKCRWLYNIIERDVIGNSLVYDSTTHCIDRTFVDGLCIDDFRAKFIKEFSYVNSETWRRKKQLPSTPHSKPLEA